jgi:nucleoside-diphosphate-sugar epimerase
MDKYSVLVTGANGFVGRPLCTALLGLGYRVKALTRSPDVFESDIQNVVVTNLQIEAPALEVMEGVDTVIHLAARVHIMQESVADELVTLAAYRAVNVAMTLNLARQAARAGVQRFIYISTIKVNGEKTEPGKPFAPDDVPAPQDPYGISKMEAELALFALSQETGIEVVIIRPPLIYGPGVGANFMAMMRLVSYQFPLPFGALHNQRSMLALDNLLSFIATCIEHPKAAGQVFLVSDGQDISVTQLLRKLAYTLNVKARLVPLPAGLIQLIAKVLGRGSVAQRLCDNLQVDNAKTEALLAWKPPLSLDEGLELTADWYLKK